MTSLVESELNDIFEGVITLTSKRKIISEDIFPRLVLASKDQRWFVSVSLVMLKLKLKEFSAGTFALFSLFQLLVASR